MADSIFNQGPPRWQAFGMGEEIGQALGGIIGGTIKAATNDRKESNMNFMQAWGRGFLEAQDSNYDLKQKMAMLSLEEQKTALDIQHMTLDDKKQGMKEYPEWLKATGGDWKKMMTTPFDGTSNFAAELVAKQKQQAWMRSIQEEAANAKMTDAENRVKVAQIKAETDAQRIAAQKEISAANIKSRETIATLKKQADEGFTPREIPFGNATLVQLGPHRWQYVRGQTAKVMTPLQLQTFANSLDPKDPKKAILLEAAENEAVQQVTGTKPTAPSTKPATDDPFGLFTK